MEQGQTGRRGRGNLLVIFLVLFVVGIGGCVAYLGRSAVEGWQLAQEVAIPCATAKTTENALLEAREKVASGEQSPSEAATETQSSLTGVWTAPGKNARPAVRAAKAVIDAMREGRSGDQEFAAFQRTVAEMECPPTEALRRGPNDAGSSDRIAQERPFREG